MREKIRRIKNEQKECQILQSRLLVPLDEAAQVEVKQKSVPLKIPSLETNPKKKQYSLQKLFITHCCQISVTKFEPWFLSRDKIY